MKNSKIVGIILFTVIVFQCIFFFDHDEFFVYTFAVGLKNEFGNSSNVIYILVLLSAIFFTYFYFSETVYRLTHGYGKLYIIRRYSKTKLMLKETGKTLISLICIVLFQAVLAYLFMGDLKTLSVPIIIACVCSYLLGAFACVLLQMYLELYIEPHKATIALCAYTFISYSVVNRAAELIPNNYLVKFVFFPSLMFGEINGAIENVGQYAASICFLAVLSVCLIFANIYKFKKSDVF